MNDTAMIMCERLIRAARHYAAARKNDQANAAYMLAEQFLVYDALSAEQEEQARSLLLSSEE